MLAHSRSIFVLVVAAGAAACLALPAAAATPPVTNVSFATNGGAFALSVDAGGSVTTRTQRLLIDKAHDVQALVVDVSPAAYAGKTKVLGFTAGKLRQARIGQLSSKPAVFRVVLESNGKLDYDLKPVTAGRGFVLSVHTTQTASTLPQAQAIAAARAANSAVESSMESSINNVATTTPTIKATPKTTTITKTTNTAPAPKKPVAAAPAPHLAAAPRAPHLVAVSQPAIVARATPNPWLPGGKYYCKVPSKHRAGTSPSSANTSMEGPPPPSSVAGVSPSSGTVNLSVKNADILDVLRLLSRQSGQNIIATQGVKGTVSVDIHDVPLKQALDLIVRSNGLDYRRIGNVYVVGTPDELNKQFGNVGGIAAQTVAFPIKYANPTDLGKQLATVIPPGSFTVDPRTDTLLVYGSPDVVQSARNFLALADVPAPQVTFEVKVVDVTRNNDTLNAGVNYAGQSTFDLFENCLGCTGAQFNQGTVFTGNTIGFQPFSRNALVVQAQLNYLITHNEATLLANPRISALDNQQANLLVGQQYPLVYFDPRAGQFQAQYIDIGVKVYITPTINTDGYITTVLHTERSTISGLVQTFPIINTRKADSTLRVKDGDTIVMGGMLDDEEIKTMSKVPLLGDIPILGALFKNVQKSKFHNEVVFLITPHVIAEKAP